MCLLGVLARLQIADGRRLVRPSGKNDRPQDQLHRGGRAVEMAQFRSTVWFDRDKQFSACYLVRKTAFQPCHRQDWRSITPPDGQNWC